LATLRLRYRRSAMTEMAELGKTVISNYNEDVQSATSHENSPKGATPCPVTIAAVPAPAIASGLSLRFIDERQRQRSSKVRREVRSHVRRNTHMKQKRLNEASKPSFGQRRILLKATNGHHCDSDPVSEGQSMEILHKFEMPLDHPLSRWQFNNCKSQ
jgi:hypothetical protein